MGIFAKLFAPQKQTVTAEYLGQCLADEIWKDVHQPQDPIPSTYNLWEWLIVRTFVATRNVQTLLSRDLADRALSAMHAQICHPGHFESRNALTAFQGIASSRYEEYLNAFNTWATQKNERPLTIALASHDMPPA